MGKIREIINGSRCGEKELYEELLEEAEQWQGIVDELEKDEYREGFEEYVAEGS